MRLPIMISAAVLWICGQAQMARAEESAVDPELKARVERIIVELGDPSATVRDRADLRLRNLPLPAYPLVTNLYEKDKENLDTEARTRIESSIQMFQALAALDRRSEAYWKWIRENSLKAYDEDSDRSPRWDKPAREALELAMSWPRSAAQSERMQTLFAQAAEAGCTDPLFIYYNALLYGPDERTTVKMLYEARDSITLRYPYPPWLRCLVASRARVAAVGRPDLEPPQDDSAPPPPATTGANLIFQHMIKPEDNVPEPLLYDIADMISKTHGNYASKYWYEQLSKPFDRLAPDSVYLHVLKGVLFGRYAYAADRNHNDPNEADAVRKEYFRIAQEELEKAWQTDPKLAIVPTEMLRILFWRDAEREEFDTWFKRAMAVNPDNLVACRLMLQNLPYEEKLEFGRQCFMSRNYRGRLTFMLEEAHDLMAKASEDKVEYWLQPQVWKEIKQLYETELELFPQSIWDRSYYALLANRCHQWAEADKQFKMLGDKPSLKVFGSMTSYNYQRKKAARNLAATPADGGK